METEFKIPTRAAAYVAGELRKLLNEEYKHPSRSDDEVLYLTGVKDALEEADRIIID